MAATVRAHGGLPARVRVADVMRGGLLSCDLDAPLRTVAREMAQRQVYAVVVSADTPGWRILSVVDVAAAIASGAEQTAGDAAANWVVTVSADDRLKRAAQLMAEHELPYLIVVDPTSREPVGLLSALDIAGVYGASSPGEATPRPRRRPARSRARSPQPVRAPRRLPPGAAASSNPSTT